jgi:hypothetical protein
MFQWDDWQQALLDKQAAFIASKSRYRWNIELLAGRQVGKSEVIAALEAEYLVHTPKAHMLISSGVERQAGTLYSKILDYILRKYPDKVWNTKKRKPLKTVFELKNGAVCRTEPLGVDGAGARRHTLTRLVLEEMQLIPEEAFAALIPMLFTTGGDIHMLGTAWATEGYVHERLSDPDFEVYTIDAEVVAEKRPEPQRTIMLEHLKRARDMLTESEYMREYKAIPSSNLRQIFPDSLIKACQVLKRPQGIVKAKYSCGIDPAGLGEDEGAISVLDVTNKDCYKQVDFVITEKKLTTETTDIILGLENRYKFRNIYVDDGGVGFGVFSELMNHSKTRTKTVRLNNASKFTEGDDNDHKKILKEAMYTNLLAMMERGKIQLLDDPEIRESLKSCKFEYSKKTGKLLITSAYNHPTESLVRAAWHYQEQGLSIWAR